MPEEGKKLTEARMMAEAREAGMTLKEIAEEFDVSESTVHRRLKLWEKSVGPKAEEDEERLESAKTIISTVRGILSDMKVSERLGEITGADAATIEQTLKRIMDKKATKAEIHKIFSNISGVIRGYIEGKEVHKSLKLPEREPIAGREEVEELRKEVEELKAVVGRASEKEKKKRKKEKGEE